MVLRERLLHFPALLNRLIISFPQPPNLTLCLLILPLPPLPPPLPLLPLPLPPLPLPLLLPRPLYALPVYPVLAHLGCEVLYDLHELHFLAFH